MSTENWRDIPGFEGRYQVSDLGRVRSLPFMQRYLLRNGVEAYRRTTERVLALHPNNNGYLLAHLYLDSRRVARTAHRLVAEAFVPNPQQLPEVNHRDGVKVNCAAVNLEWATSVANKQHALASGLYPKAVRVRHPATGEVFPSIAQAARAARCRASVIAATWERA